MTVEANWRERERRWEYHIPGVQGFVTPDRPRTSIVSSSVALAREVRAIAPRIGVRLPSSFSLVIRRGGF